MNGNNYLLWLRFHLLPLPRRVRSEVLQEVSSHLTEAEMRGGERLLSDTLERFGPPSKLAMNYIRVWGVSPLFILFTGALGFILGLFSAPIKFSFIGYVPPLPIPSLLYIFLLFLLALMSYRYGLKTGAITGLMSGAGYISNVILSYDLYRDWTTLTDSDIYTLAFNTMLLPAAGAVLGYLGERFWELGLEKEGQV